MKTQFLGGAYLARSTNLNAQRAINLFAESTVEGGRDVGAFFGTPGLVSWLDIGTGKAINGGIVANGYLWIVSDNKLYKIASDKTITTLGSIPNTGRVIMAFNGTQIAVATGGTGYYITVSDGSIAIMDGFPYGAKTVAYVDSFFLAEKPDTQEFYQSASSDASTWDALDFASKEGAPDNLSAVITDHREVWLFGEKTIEVWYNAGTSTFAFARIQGSFIEHGIAAPYTAAKLDNSVYWLSQDQNGKGIVMRAAGYQPERISTHAIEFAFSQYSTISDAYSWVYQQDGHSFYCLTFPTGNATWCYDISTGLWHERTYFNNGSHNKHRANCAFYFADQVLVGDHSNGKLYAFDLESYTDDGQTIKRLRSWGNINNEGKRFRVNELELIMQTGVGLTSGQGSDPVIMMRFSDDGGATWSNEHQASIGKIGNTNTRALWRRLGVSRDRVFEVSISDPVKVAWIGANIQGDLLK